MYSYGRMEPNECIVRVQSSLMSVLVRTMEPNKCIVTVAWSLMSV